MAFTIRRQIHEALVHSIDADMAVGRPLPDVAPKLAADGVDEIIGVMLTGTPEWAAFEPDDGVLRLSTLDTGDSWALRPGTVVGTPPDGDADVRLAGYELVDLEPTAIIEADALDLLLWMWGRLDPSVLSRSTDDAATQLLRTTITEVTG